VSTTIRVPAYLGEATDGDIIAITRQTISFPNGQPLIEDIEIQGQLSNMVRVSQIPHIYIAGRLTESNGKVHEIKSRPDYHIKFLRVPDGTNWNKTTVAVTVGVFSPGWPTDDEGLVCINCYRPSDIFMAEFATTELEPGEACTRCGKVFVPRNYTHVAHPVKIQWVAYARNGIEGLVTRANANGIEVDWGTTHGGKHVYSLDEVADAEITFQVPNSIAAVTFEPDGLTECTSCAIVGASTIRSLLNEAELSNGQTCCKCNKVLGQD
jgi:hypothetical protein